MYLSNMRRLAVLLLAVVITSAAQSSSHGTETNKTEPEVPVEASITSDDDSEQELSSQLREVDGRAGGWSSWSQWSACSRSCDGGVSHQLRTCQTGSCRGEHVRYKICNMQIFTAVLAAVAIQIASSVSAPVTKVLQGPSTKTTIVGPEGSVIQAVAPGGKIIQEEHPGYVAQSAPVYPSVHAVPVLSAQYSSPILTSNHGEYSGALHGYNGALHGAIGGYYSSPITYQNYGGLLQHGAHQGLNAFPIGQAYHAPIANYGIYQGHHNLH